MEGMLTAVAFSLTRSGGHVDRGGLLLDEILGLLLGGDEEDLPAGLGQLLHLLGSLIDLADGLVQVDDVDSVLLVEDIGSHLGVPLTGQVAEVNTCIKQFLEICT